MIVKVKVNALFFLTSITIPLDRTELFVENTPFAISEWTQNTVREAVLELLREISQSKLSKLCQISQPLLSGIVNNKYEGKIGKRKCEEFGKWYNQYRKDNPIGVCGNQNTEQRIDTLTEENSSEEKERDSDKNFSQRVKQSSETRLTFHSSLEVPQLRQWFGSNPKPSDPILLKYAELLNQSPLRQERTKVTLKSLKNWWKNERQRERNLSKKKSKQKTDTNLGPNQLLSSCSTSVVDIEINQTGHSSEEEEPTLTMAFTADDSEDIIL